MYKGVLKLPNGGTRDIAIKSLRRQMVLQYQKEFDLEIKIMLNLKHENIVEIIGQCPQKNKGESCIWFKCFLFDTFRVVLNWKR